MGGVGVCRKVERLREELWPGFANVLNHADNACVVLVRTASVAWSFLFVVGAFESEFEASVQVGRLLESVG